MNPDSNATDRPRPNAASAPADGGPAWLSDRFGRIHDSLRLSVTDRCNIRCFYCMPESGVQFVPKDHLLTFEQITHVVRVMTTVGLKTVRLTGGEPLVRNDLPVLVRMLTEIGRLQDLAMTTNGMLLARDADALRRAGLRRVNISLDTLHEETFRKISRRSGLDRVLAGIDAAIAAGFDEVRLNALAIRDLTEAEAIPLVEFAVERGLTMRFIEYMPLDADRQWETSRVLSGDELLSRLETHFGRLTPISREHPAQPATDYALPGGTARIGLIRPVTQPFCNACNRLRLTAEGTLRNCLFSQREWSLRESLQTGASDAELLREIRRCLAAKEPGHLIDQPDFQQPARAMYQIGG